MIKRLLATVFVCLFFVGCGAMSITPSQIDPSETLVDVAAFTLGYKGFEKNQASFTEAYDILDNQYELSTITKEQAEDLVRKLKEELSDEITTDPILKRNLSKIFGVINIEFTGDLVVIDVKELKYTRVALTAFKEGIGAAMIVKAGK